jgi:hypothetical protein
MNVGSTESLGQPIVNATAALFDELSCLLKRRKIQMPANCLLPLMGVVLSGLRERVG